MSKSMMMISSSFNVMVIVSRPDCYSLDFLFLLSFFFVYSFLIFLYSLFFGFISVNRRSQAVFSYLVDVCVFILFIQSLFYTLFIYPNLIRFQRHPSTPLPLPTPLISTNSRILSIYLTHLHTFIYR